MKKIIIALGFLLGLLSLAPLALAVDIAPSAAPSGTTIQNAGGSAGAVGSQAMPATGAVRVGMPCMMSQASGGSNMNMMYRTAPCGPTMYQQWPGSSYGFDSNLRSWFALMAVLTILMVWVALLLLIGVLWHMLKKHRKG